MAHLKIAVTVDETRNEDAARAVHDAFLISTWLVMKISRVQAARCAG